jgi:hypothetical protein
VLIAKKGLVAAHPSDGRPGSERPKAVAGKPHYGKEHFQGKELQAHVSSSWVDELWQEREEEDGCLRCSSFKQFRKRCDTELCRSVRNKLKRFDRLVALHRTLRQWHGNSIFFFPLWNLLSLCLEM